MDCYGLGGYYDSDNETRDEDMAANILNPITSEHTILTRSCDGSMDNTTNETQISIKMELKTYTSRDNSKEQPPSTSDEQLKQNNEDENLQLSPDITEQELRSVEKFMDHLAERTPRDRNIQH